MAKKKNKNEVNCSKALLFSIIILFCIISFSIFSAGFSILKPSNNEPHIPTGNVDIFDVNCTCPSGDTENQEEISTTSPVGTQNNQKSPLKENELEQSSMIDSYENEKEVSGFNIFDNKLHWELNTELRIFTHPAYEFNSVIAPGYSNSYEYRIRNNNPFDVMYSMSFMENNINNINIKYRLRKNSEYFVGSEEEWVSYNYLNKTNILLRANEYDSYFLDWKWVESANDTKIGTLDNANYNLTIEIFGVENEDS